jgi:hypothetical protein
MEQPRAPAYDPSVASAESPERANAKATCVFTFFPVSEATAVAAAKQIISPGEALSIQRIGWRCIDRLNRQGLPGAEIEGLNESNQQTHAGSNTIESNLGRDRQ